MAETEPATSHLVTRLMAGEHGVMSDLYDTYADALYNIVVRIVRDATVAEDILQEAFIRVWTKRATYVPERGTLFTWMLNVTRNLALDHLKRADTRTTESADRAVTVEVQDRQGAIQDTSETVDVPDLVRRLPPDQQHIIDLVYFKGYTQAEISTEFGIPLGTVKSRVRLAMNALRHIYGVSS